jgi:hypothetical protein
LRSFIASIRAETLGQSTSVRREKNVENGVHADRFQINFLEALLGDGVKKRVSGARLGWAFIFDAGTCGAGLRIDF